MRVRLRLFLALAGAWAVSAGCATSSDVAGVLGEAPATGGFGDPDASVPTPDADAGEDVLMCVATECPSPYLTCPSGDGPTFKCAVDPRRDSNHCGACDQACPSFPTLNMRSRCADSKCALECVSVPRTDGVNEFPTDYRNCNNVTDDGCESDVLLDEANCGACGNACAPGVRCIEGSCGCPKGTEACMESCVDVQRSNDHCGACFNGCPYFEGCDPLPIGTEYGCVDAECGKLKCRGSSGDCDNDLGLGCGSNGCESDLTTTENCGGCGIVCKPTEMCRTSQTGASCVPNCETNHLTTCFEQCVNTLDDVDNCGGCGLVCPSGGANTQRTCEKGVCTLQCSPNSGDCNGDASDGCETNLLVHPAHCGACGNACSIPEGQPCVEGKCLAKPCDPSEAK